ncbi:hypothetical protein D3C78_1725390 [compost metagenome]
MQVTFLAGIPVVAVEHRTESRVIEKSTNLHDMGCGFGDMVAMWVKRKLQPSALDNG